MNHNLPCYRIIKYDEDEEVLQLKRAAIQAKLKLKKLQKNRAAMSQEHTADTMPTVFKRAREKEGCNHHNPKRQRTGINLPSFLKLRQELKDWERAFANSHDGCKPTRQDVKEDTKITAKYKQYSKICGSTSTTSEPPSSNRPHEDNPIVFPLPLPLSPPVPAASKAPTASAATHVYNSPLSTLDGRTFGNHSRDSVGPTPQKTGKILGIFESFSNVDPLSTPRKRKAHDLSGALGSSSYCDSSTKQTPKDILSTPAFLRRNNRFTAFLDSPPVPWTLRPPVRGLSTMVAELRKMENNAHASQEAMREMEEEMMGPSPALLPAGASATKPRVRSFKRQHRYVILRPVGRIAHHPDDPNCQPPPPNPEGVQLPAAGYDDEDLDDLDVTAVPAAPEPESADPREAARAKRAKIMAEDVVRKGKGTVRKAARKTSKKAHANYKRVNIRGSKGAKAGNGDRKFFRR